MIEIDTNPDKKKLRGFGWIAFVFFGFWTYWTATRSHLSWLPILFGTIAAYSLIGALLLPKILKWLFLALTFLAFPIGWVVSNVLLLIIFYLIFFPIGLLLRLFGHDPLNRKWKKDASNWITSKTDRPAKSYYQTY